MIESRPRPTFVSFPTFAAAEVALVIYADALDDIEHIRIATENRVRALRSVDVKNLAGSPPDERLSALVEALQHVEDLAVANLRSGLAGHPLQPWIRRTIGVGAKQGARLLAAIGDPYWNDRDDRPRTVSELWAYCGLHVIQNAGDSQPLSDGVQPGSHPDQSATHAQVANVGVAPARRKGQQSNWNSGARQRAFLVAQSCIKHRHSPFRSVYDAGREKYRDAAHAVPCAQCGPRGKPAAVGSPLSPGHQHARAMRLVMKAILKDLWIEARALHADVDAFEVAS